MDSITIYPENEKQKSLLKSLLKEMRVRFEIGKSDDQILLSEDDFIAKINTSIEQADSGNSRKLTAEQQKELLGL